MSIRTTQPQTTSQLTEPYMPLQPGRARCVPVGAGNPGELQPSLVIRRDTLSCKNTDQPSYALGLLSGWSNVGRGTSGGHERAIRQETLRTAEISAGGMLGTSAEVRKTPAHKTRPTVRLTFAHP
jgi:hypothetical protein